MLEMGNVLLNLWFQFWNSLNIGYPEYYGMNLLYNCYAKNE